MLVNLNEKKMYQLKNKVNLYTTRSDVFGFKRLEKSFVFNNQGAINFEINESEQIALRLEYDNGIGYATSSGRFNENELIELAIETSRFNTSNSNFNLIKRDIIDVKIYDPQIENLENLHFVEFSNNLIKQLKKYGVDFECKIYTISDDILYVDIESNMKSYKKTMIKISFEGHKTENNINYYYNYRQASCKNLNFVKEIIEAIYQQSKYFPAKSIDSPKTFNAILSPFAVYSIFRNYIALNFNAKRALSENLELPNYNSKITIYDIGIVDWKIGSQPFDDEGTPCQSTTLVKNGTSQQFYCDSFTSNCLQIERTGNAKRGWGTPPSPVPNNLIIRGSKIYSNLFEKLGDGIYIDYVINDGKTDTIGGIFSGEALRAFYISGGTITHKLTNLNILLNITKTLNEEMFFGNDYKWIAGEFNTPSILVSNLKVY